MAGAKKPRILWLGDEESCTTELLMSRVVVESNWCLEHVHKTADDVQIRFKAGNKDYSLKRYVETNQAGKPETRLSESYLKKLYSEFWPIRKHFFFVRVDDRRKAYRPVYQTVFDIPTALAFFGTNPASTLTCVGRMASAIVASWNNTWSNQPEVLLFLLNHLSHSYKSIPVVYQYDTTLTECLCFTELVVPSACFSLPRAVGPHSLCENVGARNDQSAIPSHLGRQPAEA